MAQLVVEKSQLKGSVLIPSSKSQTLRALLFASLAQGKSFLVSPLVANDVETMVQACRMLGAKIFKQEEGIEVEGVGGRPALPENVIDAGNSGIALRFLGAVSALSEGYTVITGDLSLRSNRQVGPLLKGLSQLGAFAVSTRNNGMAPIVVKGPMHAGKVDIDGQDSQPVSALLIAAAFLEGMTEIYVRDPGEKPWVDMTLHWLRKLSVPVYCEEHRYYRVQGIPKYPGFEMAISGDFSSAAFPLVAALITQGEVLVGNLDIDDPQGDKRLLTTLKEMGASLQIDTKERRVSLSPSSCPEGRTIDVNDMIDALPILAVVGCFAQGKTRLVNALSARYKESDRIFAICKELSKMGARIKELEDGLEISPAALKGAVVSSHGDHRIAMALAVAGMAASGQTRIEEAECIGKTYASFASQMQELGGRVLLNGSL